MTLKLDAGHYLIIGLGNPGPEYVGTRHNIGFLQLDALLETNKIAQSFYSLDAYCSEALFITLADKPVWLLKPQTYMNRSGLALKAVLKDNPDLDPGRIVVVHDDLDLQLGRIKLKSGGGSGGHNGLNSLIRESGSDRFLRLRLGIGSDMQDQDTVGFVLSSFADSEKDLLREVLRRGGEALRILLQNGPVVAMNQTNGRISV
ncbi:MAG: aminoacyl-tRNA hydrolase [Deltaproteobacteria bacterium]|nr:aminoacyl-tRNA hydrolase [Deltaproteobacteria bacterium]